VQNNTICIFHIHSYIHTYIHSFYVHLCVRMCVKYVYAQEDIKPAHIRTTEIFKLITDMMQIVIRSLFVENTAIICCILT